MRESHKREPEKSAALDGECDRLEKEINRFVA